ncbi:MAG: sugar phosphate isomerase/epimerase family protein [Flavobacteriales bacterium]
MNSSLHQYMRPSIVHMMMFPECIHGAGPQLETIEVLAHDAWFEAVEVGPVNDASVRAQCINLFSQAQVQPLFVGQACTFFHALDLGSAAENQRRLAIDAMKVGIDQATQWGAKHCGVMSGHIMPDTNILQVKELLAQSLMELCDYAAPHGITLCIENFDSIPFVKNCLIGSAKETVRLAEQVRSKYDNFGIITDLSHLPLLKENPAETIQTVKEHLSYVQLGNCSLNPNSPYYGDIHPYFGAPLTNVSVAELAEFLRALLEINYLNTEQRGIVSFEVKPLDGQDPLAQIAGCKRTLEAAWRMV